VGGCDAVNIEEGRSDQTAPPHDISRNTASTPSVAGGGDNEKLRTFDDVWRTPQPPTPDFDWEDFKAGGTGKPKPDDYDPELAAELKAFLAGKSRPPSFYDLFRHKKLTAAPAPLDLGDGYQKRVWQYIEAIAGRQAMLDKGSRNDAQNAGGHKAFRLALGAGISLDAVDALIYEANVRNGQVSDDGEAQVRGTLASARRAAEAGGPDYLDDRDRDHYPPAYVLDAPAGTVNPDRRGEGPRLATLLLTRDALKKLPDPEPLIDDVLDRGTNALLYGRWGTFKSFIALDWAASVATGRDWQGRPTEKQRVLYIAAEGAFGFKGRTDAWEQGWHTLIDDDDLHILPQPVNLTRPVEVGELQALIQRNGYGFVVVDTLARSMVGGDENSAQDCGLVVDALIRLRHATPGGRGVVLGVHHTGKDGKTFRGSSVFEAGADTVYSTIRDGAVVVLDREKRKDGPPLDRHELTLDPIDGTESGVMTVHRGVNRSDRADRLLSTFVHHFAGSGATKAELRAVADMDPATFYRAVSDLLVSGELVNTGTEKRPFYKAGQL
jgi:hypothetical protein